MDVYVSTGQGILGYNVYAYCNNNPVIYLDSNGELLEKSAGCAGWGGNLNVSSWIPSTSSNLTSSNRLIATLTISLGVFSTLSSINELKKEIIAIRAFAKSQVKTAEKAEVKRFKQPEDPAYYFGATCYNGKFQLVTRPMGFQDAKKWAVVTGENRVYGRNAPWGLYTPHQAYAYAIAVNMGGGIPILHEGNPQQYNHYHISGFVFLNRYQHFHLWYGRINPG